MNNKIRNIIWTFFGILLMGVLVYATTTIDDLGISTGNVTADNITANIFYGDGSQLTGLINHTLDTYTLYNAIWSDTSNETYDIWAYNMTSASNYDYNHTLDTFNLWSSLWYNYTEETYDLYNAIWSDTSNETYDIWAYNMSIASNYDYNHTLDVFNLWGGYWYNHTLDTHTLYNAVWSDTSNDSYAGLIQNASYLECQNETYDIWAYNMTIPSDYDYNHTLDIFDLWGGLWYNYTEATYNLYNAVWSDTSNETYHDNSYNHTLDTYTLYDNKWTAMTYTNLAFTNETNIFTQNQNVSVSNVTDIDCIEFASGGKICSL